MEDTLRVHEDNEDDELESLNPCFNGRYSQSGSFVNTTGDYTVLILVLMEDTLREQVFTK